MEYFVKTKSGRKIDVSFWLVAMRENRFLKRNLFERTPICIKADKSYFWYEDFGKFKDLDAKSVKDLKKLIEKL